MDYKGYIGIVEVDDEANVLHGEVVNIRDVVTFQGETVEEARDAFRDSVDDYLAFCEERGEEPDQPFSPELVRLAGSRLAENRTSLFASLAELAAGPSGQVSAR